MMSAVGTHKHSYRLYDNRIEFTSWKVAVCCRLWQTDHRLFTEYAAHTHTHTHTHTQKYGKTQQHHD